jgi:hypothetical protein
MDQSIQLPMDILFDVVRLAGHGARALARLKFISSGFAVTGRGGRLQRDGHGSKMPDDNCRSIISETDAHTSTKHDAQANAGG